VLSVIVYCLHLNARNCNAPTSVSRWLQWLQPDNMRECRHFGCWDVVCDKHWHTHFDVFSQSMSFSDPTRSKSIQWLVFSLLSSRLPFHVVYRKLSVWTIRYPEVPLKETECWLSRSGSISPLTAQLMIATIEEPKAHQVEKPALPTEGSLDEKLSLDLNDGDEALRLLGAERTTHFSEEYNEKLKQKLVWSI